jgi:hypothetical protein
MTAGYAHVYQEQHGTSHQWHAIGVHLGTVRAGNGRGHFDLYAGELAYSTGDRKESM